MNNIWRNWRGCKITIDTRIPEHRTLNIDRFSRTHLRRDDAPEYVLWQIQEQSCIHPFQRICNVSTICIWLPFRIRFYCHFGKSIIILLATIKVWIKFTSLRLNQFENYFVISHCICISHTHTHMKTERPTHTYLYVLVLLHGVSVCFWLLISYYFTRFTFEGLIVCTDSLASGTQIAQNGTQSAH